MFTVIIPLYNKAPYIEKAIASILSQTYRSFELLIIDDGSTDNGRELVERYMTSTKAPNGGWRLETQINSGVSVTRNRGVELAKYNYIAFLDADDWWEPTYLEEMQNLITNYPDAGIYSSSYFKVKNGNNISARIGVEADFTAGYINYFKVYAKTMYQPIWTGACVVKKLIFEEFSGFKPTLKLGEDFDLWVRIAMNYLVAFLNKPLSYYNQDVDAANRAIGKKLYMPKEHFLYSDYSDVKNPDFKFLFDVLAVYGLLPYYLANVNVKETKRILSEIDWNSQPLKYSVYYRFLPPVVLKIWFKIISLLSVLRNKISN